MRVNWIVDWINWTCATSDDRNIYQYLYKTPFSDHYEAKPLYGYTHALENTLGARVMHSVQRKDMQPHVMYSGSTLNNYAKNGYSAKAIIVHHATYGDICKRIDLALDVVDSDLDIKTLFRRIDSGKATTKVKTWNLITGNTGDTLYIGSRQSEQFIRIYDKAAQKGTDDNWKRIEIELKGSRAIEFARIVATESTEATIERTRQLIKSIVDFDTPIWRAIMGDLAVGIGKAQQNEPDTVAWLLTQVAPAMGKYLQKTNDNDLLEKFLTIVRAFTDKPSDSQVT